MPKKYINLNTFFFLSMVQETTPFGLRVSVNRHWLGASVPLVHNDATVFYDAETLVDSVFAHTATLESGLITTMFCTTDLQRFALAYHHEMPGITWPEHFTIYPQPQLRTHFLQCVQHVFDTRGT
jgi:hypothetical protein